LGALDGGEELVRPALVVASLWAWHGWDALVAIGTLALALATGWLAWLTRRAVGESRDELVLLRREVEAVEHQSGALFEQTAALEQQTKATNKQATISATALEASVRPVLVGVPATFDPEREEVPYPRGPVALVERGRVHYEENEQMVYCSVPLRNVGGGIAFIQRVTLLTRTPFDGRVSNVIVLPGELVRAAFAITRRQTDGTLTDANAITRGARGFPAFTIYVVYTAASAGLVTASEVAVAGLDDGSYLVTENKIWDGDVGDRKLLASTENVGY
jgi:hypothetical protein